MKGIDMPIADANASSKKYVESFMMIDPCKLLIDKG